MIEQRLLRGAVLSMALLGCNSVFGLGEGHLASDGGSGGTGGTQSSTTTGKGPSGTTTSGSATTSGAGGACTMATGLLNGDFALQATGSPQDWLKTAYNTDVTLSTVASQISGLSMAFATIGNGAYGGVYQTRGLLSWSHCVRLTGDSQRKAGSSGQLHAQVLLGAYALEADLPSTAAFQSFEAACRLPVPIDTFTVNLLTKNLPVGGSTTMQMHQVAFDEVCCTGAEPDCGPPQ